MPLDRILPQVYRKCVSSQLCGEVREWLNRAESNLRYPGNRIGCSNRPLSATFTFESAAIIEMCVQPRLLRSYEKQADVDNDQRVEHFKRGGKFSPEDGFFIKERNEP